MNFDPFTSRIDKISRGFLFFYHVQILHIIFFSLPKAYFYKVFQTILKNY